MCGGGNGRVLAQMQQRMKRDLDAKLMDKWKAARESITCEAQQIKELAQVSLTHAPQRPTYCTPVLSPPLPATMPPYNPPSHMHRMVLRLDVRVSAVWVWEQRR